MQQEDNKQIKINLTHYLDLCKQNIEIAQKFHHDQVQKTFSALNYYMVISGTVAAFGFAALDHVEHLVLFFIAEFLLLNVIIFCLHAIRILSTENLIEISENYVFYLKKRKEINSALYENDLSKQTVLLEELNIETMKKVLETEYDHIKTEAVAFDFKINIIIWITGLAFICLLVSFISFNCIY